jgi:hypothetical protein
VTGFTGVGFIVGTTGGTGFVVGVGTSGIMGTGGYSGLKAPLHRNKFTCAT